MSALDRTLDVARDLPPPAVAAIGAAAAFLAVVAIGLQLGVRALARELSAVEEELVDPATGLLPRGALRVRLGAELAWAAASSTPIAVAVLRVRGGRFTRATAALRNAMRGEEQAFLLGDGYVAVELWGADAAAADDAVARLGRELARAGHPVVDAGTAVAPRDGSDVQTLVEAARRDLRPIDEAHPNVRRSGAAHVLAVSAGIAPWFVAMCALLWTTSRLVPVALAPLEEAADVVALVAALAGVPLAAALLVAAGWNRSGGPAPRSRPLLAARVRAVAGVAALVALPLAVAAALAHDLLGQGGPQPTGVVAAAVLALVTLTLLQARQAIHLPSVALVPLVLAGAGVTWLAVEASSLPTVANSGRLLLAAALGALLARQVERVSWLVGLALLAAASDTWSVLAETGLTRGLLDPSASAGANRLVELLVFTGPTLDGAGGRFGIGVTDLVFTALFLAWSHDWRIDMRVATLALVLATWIALGVAEMTAEFVPVLPFLVAAMLGLLAARELVTHLRVRREGAADASPPARVGSPA